LFNLGWVYQDLGQPARALPFLKRSLDRSASTASIVPKLYVLIARCLRALGQADEALSFCREGLRHAPEDAELLFVEALVLRDRGDLAAAEASLLCLLSSGPAQHFTTVEAGLNGYRARHNLAVICSQQGRPSEAAAQWRMVVMERPDFMPAWLGLAELHLRQGSWEALEEVARSLQPLRQGGLEAALLRARACLARKEFAAARTFLDPCVASFPTEVAPRVLRSRSFLQEGKDPASAEQALREVLALEPNHAEARHNLEVLRHNR
jgi:tetratricopeptide (TPR) repeat protein